MISDKNIVTITNRKENWQSIVDAAKNIIEEMEYLIDLYEVAKRAKKREKDVKGLITSREKQ